jgi:hypothetical protein
MESLRDGVVESSSAAVLLALAARVEIVTTAENRRI